MTGEEVSTKGGDGDGYRWTQDGDEVEITFDTPPNTKGKQVKAGARLFNFN
jgi:hypothetical protein